MVVNAVLAGKGNFGYDAQNGQYGEMIEMIEMGVLDPTEVTRTALQNAASRRLARGIQVLPGSCR